MSVDYEALGGGSYEPERVASHQRQLRAVVDVQHIDLVGSYDLG